MAGSTVSGGDKVGGLVGNAPRADIDHSYVTGTTVFGSVLVSAGGLSGNGKRHWYSSFPYFRCLLLLPAPATTGGGGLVGETDLRSGASTEMIKISYSYAIGVNVFRLEH